jgi:hypothetical protein
LVDDGVSYRFKPAGAVDVTADRIPNSNVDAVDASVRGGTPSR